jgi:nitrogen-specific signal transduction histidine kinase/CheY-like chemotaxis protein
MALLRLDLGRREAELEEARAALQREAADHRATTESLHHAQKLEALGQLTGGIAHDFNNLLMVVLSSLELLRKRLPEGDLRAARLLDNAVQGADRGAALTQRLLAFGRRQTLRPASVALAALLGGMEELLRRSISPAHRIDVRLPDVLPPVRIDPNQLELALMNLVLNARDAMPAGGDIVIAARQEQGRFVVLSVADRGAGMDAATLARATEPFFTTKAAGKGTGLGLSMVHGLAAQSGGRLVLRSHPGEGTTAEIWLPMADADVPPAGEGAHRAPPPPRRLTILVVDDDPLVRASTAAMLEDLGHAVIEAESGPAALARLRDTAVDRVLTDYGMPGMTGGALAAEIGRRHPGLPVIVATGYGEVPGEPMADIETLAKPFDQQTLSQRIEGALRQVA